MTKKIKSKNSRLLILFALLVSVSGVAVALKLTEKNTSILTPVNPSASHASPTPSPALEAGNIAKSEISKAQGATSQTFDSSKTTPPPSAGTSNFIQNFSVSARGSGQYVATVLSQTAASGKCTLTLSPSSGSPVTKAGTIVSSGTYLSCDFGGIIPVQGSGNASLIVTGSDGKTDTKETIF